MPPRRGTIVAMDALLEVENLRRAFGDRLAVDDVSFRVGRGEIFGLLGPNGAGKTTTISCIAGLLAPDSGVVKLAGRPFEPRTNVAQRAAIGLVPQELALYDMLTARENLEFFAAMSGVESGGVASACDRALEIAGLADRARDRVSTFSGGMKRRLNLAIGELHQPDLLILDEPTVGVDPQSRNHVFEALERLAADGRAIVYTTHYMEEAERLCSRVAIVDGGRILDQGEPSELATRAEMPGADLEKVFLHLTGRRLRDS